jgi:tRNA-Thr(GGU) m(6)t(6)A37 methyltransferase TsaA
LAQGEKGLILCGWKQSLLVQRRRKGFLGSDMKFYATPIGIIHSPNTKSAGTPIQAASASGIQGTVEVFPEYQPGLRDLDGFERIWLLYWCDRANAPQMSVTPYLDTTPRGLFATRAPSRPNPIGISCVRLVRVVGRMLQVDGLDMLDNTPLLDIKPYVPAFDVFQVSRIGWCEQAHQTEVADGRFEAPQSTQAPHNAYGDKPKS